MMNSFRETHTNWKNGEINNWEDLLKTVTNFSIILIIIVLLVKAYVLPQINNTKANKNKTSNVYHSKQVIPPSKTKSNSQNINNTQSKEICENADNSELQDKVTEINTNIDNKLTDIDETKGE